MNSSVLIKLLTYLGSLPFFIAVYLSWSQHTFLGVDGIQWFLTYGLVILSFMAGTLWGQVVNESIQIKSIALASNAVTLAAWFAFLLVGPTVVLIISALGFIVLYVFEVLMMTDIKRPDYYLALRLRVTTLVVVAHGLMVFQV
jgi:hypothetical protein